MNWRVKAVVQKILSSVPGGTRVNTLLQRKLGNLKDFEGNVDAKVVGDWLVLMDHMREVDVRPRDMSLVEVGTGWYPTLPVCYSLAGAKRCITFDVNRHLNENLTFRMLRRLRNHLGAIAEAAGRGLADVEREYERMVATRSVSELLSVAGIEYVSPGDASRTGLGESSIDAVFSNSVLEHVPPDVIRQIMTESRRILRDGGFAIHSVNCGDHYAYFDRQISLINYLQYSTSEWKFWNNRLLYQNRLRPGDFLSLAADAGLTVVLAKFKPRQDLLEALSCMKVASEFSNYPMEQLACSSIDFVAVR
jgi:hypothetical protein